MEACVPDCEVLDCVSMCSGSPQNLLTIIYIYTHIKVIMLLVTTKILASIMLLAFPGAADAHASEYVRSSDMRRAWLSRFTGSAGTAVVTERHAKLWTGRYSFKVQLKLENS